MVYLGLLPSISVRGVYSLTSMTEDDFIITFIGSPGFRSKSLTDSSVIMLVIVAGVSISIFSTAATLLVLTCFIFPSNRFLALVFMFNLGI